MLACFVLLPFKTVLAETYTLKIGQSTKTSWGGLEIYFSGAKENEVCVLSLKRTYSVLPLFVRKNNTFYINDKPFTVTECTPTTIQFRN